MPDLITRYNLQSKVAAGEQQGKSDDDADSQDGSGSKAKGWSASKDERQSLLQRRRDQMILEARRKMEAKLAAENAAQR